MNKCLFEVFRVTELGGGSKDCFPEPSGCPVMWEQRGKMASGRDAPVHMGWEEGWCCDHFSRSGRDSRAGTTRGRTPWRQPCTSLGMRRLKPPPQGERRVMEDGRVSSSCSCTK